MTDLNSSVFDKIIHREYDKLNQEMAQWNSDPEGNRQKRLDKLNEYADLKNELWHKMVLERYRICAW